MGPLVEALAEGLHPYVDVPFALFGHSLGAWVGFDLARVLRRRYQVSPVRLFVSARRAPHLPNPLVPMHHLPEAQFVQELDRRYNAIPDVIRNDRELLDLYLPIIRADLAVLETYVWADDDPLDCPISVFGGLQDTGVPREALDAWRMHTARYFELVMFEGDHFFHQSARASVVQVIGDTLQESLAQPTV
jgi:medium-chain acyl-[acyl-carrier-protein] hydrolase